MATYDRDEKPETPPEALNFARANGLMTIQILCEETAEKVSDQTGVNFIAHVQSVPSIGNLIQLEDRGAFRVTEVCHKMVTCHESASLSAITAHVIVFAVRVTAAKPGG
jgi:hypothetical protein